MITKMHCPACNTHRYVYTLWDFCYVCLGPLDDVDEPEPYIIEEDTHIINYGSYDTETIL